MPKSYTPELKEVLSAAGCYFYRHGKGDHDIWVCPGIDRPIPVDNRILSRHTANGVLKQAGLAKKF